MREKLTAVFRKSRYGYIGYVEELPGANTQGKTLEETRKNLIEAVQFPDGHLKIPHVWPGQNPPPQCWQNGVLFSCFSFLTQVF